MKKTLEEKMENACTRMVGKGKLPGFIYLSKKTLTVLAEEWKLQEVKIKELKDSSSTPPKLVPYTCYFMTDNSLPLGKFKIGPMDEKYFEHVKKLRVRAVKELIINERSEK